LKNCWHRRDTLALSWQVLDTRMTFQSTGKYDLVICDIDIVSQLIA
jgi:hypothetical protein